MTTTPVPPSLIATLPGRYYTDPEVFRQEQRHVFETMWFCAVRAADLERPGAFRTVQVGRENVLVTRTRTGGLRAFLNICRHRGARLCLEESGEVRRTLQCPYHAWTYDLDGRLVAAPNLTKMPDVDRSEYGLVEVALREWLGYAWVCLAEEPPSFEETVRGAVVERLGDPAAVEAYGTEGLALGRRVRYEVRANWKLIVENFMECYHCATIHPELTDVLPEFADGYAAQYYVGHGAEFGEEVRGFTVDGSEGFGRLPEVPDGRDRRYYAVTVRPTVFVNLVPDHVILHRMFPLAEDRTVVECDWLYAPEVVASGADLSKSVELFHRVNTQDFAACERTQPAMASRAYRAGGVLVPTEHHIGMFHQWLLDRLGAGPAGGGTS
ncbi:aromatic ring-hydroxylating dioxygenase subunit alpha [Streptomyces olivaceus]|uniref:aromatic ring-hydroxylating oxygenase subunit alpha n=1 Tax=Streptomyces olivaceus TaxID=47716 RepID=UPI001CCDA522|nr:aromatic ring-hydroxylating dioxygenase subunit alpha [Streptomyces olivaceus]MBZ6194835.1 aromatic ring-hydroxylating dioxygenase subunit alpha [Streptomyces olivaceus]MBZ6290484.1 aromatic ring-hydroxylating dioxygenase subunit alpha [Streptomyces olivaceus]MBZ6324436.1 aromatic ring-hydroxylating dioxygenase subunit alpha [Streptomyces olivaceus]